MGRLVGVRDLVGGGWEGVHRTSCRGELRVASVRRDLGAEDSRAFLGLGMVCKKAGVFEVVVEVKVVR